jgi:hypothetical protein
MMSDRNPLDGSSLMICLFRYLANYLFGVDMHIRLGGYVTM